MSQPQAPKDLTLREVFANAPLRRLWLAQIVSVLGDFVAIFAVFSLVSFKMHGTPAEVSLIMISYLAPTVFVSPVAGVFVDRWHPRRTMIVSDLIRGFLILLLVPAHELWQIYAILMGISAVSSFFMPAQTITLRTLVPKEGLMAANALMMQAFQVTQILSPVFAGFLAKWLGEKACFYLDSGTFFISALLVSTIAIHRPAATGGKDLRSVSADLNAGMKFIFTHSTLAFVILSMAAGLFAIRCYSALIAIYVRDILHAEAGLFGTMGTLVGVGMIIGTQIVSRLNKSVSRPHLMLGGLIGVGFCILLFALISSTVPALIVTAAMGVCVALVVISAQTLMQGQTPIEMLGRVTSSLMSVLSAAQIAGMALAGSVAQAIGIRNSYLVSAALLGVIALAGWKKAREAAIAHKSLQAGA